MFLSYPQERLPDARRIVNDIVEDRCDVLFDNGELRVRADELSSFPLVNKLFPLATAALDFKLRSDILRADRVVYLEHSRPRQESTGFPLLFDRYLTKVAFVSAPTCFLLAAVPAAAKPIVRLRRRERRQRFRLRFATGAVDCVVLTGSACTRLVPFYVRLRFWNFVDEHGNVIMGAFAGGVLLLVFQLSRVWGRWAARGNRNG